MTQEEFIILAGKIAQGTASESEVAQYNAYYNAYQAKHPEWEGLPVQLKEEMLAETKVAIDGHLLNDDQAKVQRLWPKIAVAAAAVAALVFAVYFFTAPRHPDTSSSRTAGRDLLNDIAPGKNGATITLINGQVIQLSGAKTGVIVGKGLTYNDNTPVSSYTSSQGNERSLDPANTRDLSQGRDDGRVQNLTASTSRGQTYQFTLPDGTKVWLNADSKVSFPSQFNESERKIVLSGEGYFEVAKDKAHPFVVKTTTQEVTVLGTHFNISSYNNDAVTTTTLLEGSVKVSAFDAVAGRRNVVLKPSQQSIQNPNGGMQVRDVDVAEAVDWKNGDFIFTKETLDQIMKRVARWYDVSVDYEPGIDKQQTFGGKVSRSKNISAVLNSMQSTGKVRFKITGKNITVVK
jgi:transmembrane sensor